MAEFTPKELDLSKINNGQRYKNGDTPSEETFNAPIEAAAFVQSLVKNPIDTTNANNVGTPTVSIQQMQDGTPQLKFENLKGEEGVAKLYRYTTSIELNPNSRFALALVRFDFVASKSLFDGANKYSLTTQQLKDILNAYANYKPFTSVCSISQSRNGFGAVYYNAGGSIEISFITSDGQFNSISLQDSVVYSMGIIKTEV